MKTFYDILEVSPAASAETVLAAYRSLAKRFHPDCNKDANAAARMGEISRAYSVLSDPAKRKDYDKTLKTGGKRTRVYNVPPAVAVLTVDEAALKMAERFVLPNMSAQAQLFYPLVRNDLKKLVKEGVEKLFNN